MATITLTAFTGEKPRVIPRLLDNSAATSAINVRLDDGGLTPMNSPVQAVKLSRTGQKTIYKHLGEWLSWSGVVSVASAPIDKNRLYYTGDGSPKVKIDKEVFPLAVNRPEYRLEASVSGTGTGDIQSRLYVYTFVTSFGEESEPCPVSNLIDWKPNQTVTLKGFKTPPDGRSITSQRIYRSQTGESGTSLFFIAERLASEADYVDTIPVDVFSEVIPSISWNAPPDDLQGLISMPNGMMAAFVGRKVYFSEPYRPHAWPEKYVLSVDADIVGLGSLGTSLIVMTKGTPYLIVGATPDSMQMEKIEANMPCINARGIVDMGFAIAYPSNEGLVAVAANGEVRLVTGSLLSRTNWLELSPHNFIASQIASRYVAFYNRTGLDGTIHSGAIFFDIGETPYVIRSAERADSVFYDIEDGGLYFTRPNDSNVMRLDSPQGEPEKYYWKSKDFHTPSPISFGVIQVDSSEYYSQADEENLKRKIEQIIEANQSLIAENNSKGVVNGAPLNDHPFAGDELEPIPSKAKQIQIGIYADDVQIAQVVELNRPVRLPADFSATKWNIDVRGDVPITQIVISTSVAELMGAMR